MLSIDQLCILIPNVCLQSCNRQMISICTGCRWWVQIGGRSRQLMLISPINQLCLIARLFLWLRASEGLKWALNMCTNLGNSHHCSCNFTVKGACHMNGSLIVPDIRNPLRPMGDRKALWLCLTLTTTSSSALFVAFSFRFSQIGLVHHFWEESLQFNGIKVNQQMVNLLRLS